MITIYCQRRLRQKEMSEEYRELADYACFRLDHCRFGEEKPACKDCKIHCYRPEMRGKIREIMRWAGPRMLIYAPKAALRHIIQRIKARLSK